MSDTWISLLAALVGAIVGGAASLAGTMVVNKRQMTTNARMRLYDELLPSLARAVDALRSVFDPIGVDEVADLLAAVRRASAIAGRSERNTSHDLAVRWAYLSVVWAELAAPSPEETSPDLPNAPGTKPGSYTESRLRSMLEAIQAFSDHLGAKLG